MKRISLTVMLLLSIGFQFISAQKQETKKWYRAWVYPNSDIPVAKGVLYQLGDSSIFLSSSPFQSSPTSKFNEINIHDIKMVKFRRKGRVGNKILIGAVSGFVVGGIIGLASGDDENCFICYSPGEKALMLGTLLAIPGGLVGGIVGSLKVKIPINGNKETYGQRKRDLEEYLIRN